MSPAKVELKGMSRRWLSIAREGAVEFELAALVLLAVLCGKIEGYSVDKHLGEPIYPKHLCLVR